MLNWLLTEIRRQRKQSSWIQGGCERAGPVQRHHDSLVLLLTLGQGSEVLPLGHM